MFAGLGARVRTFWQDQRAAFARLVARDPSINREATAVHYAAVFRRERDEALAEVARLQRAAQHWMETPPRSVDTALVTIRPTREEVRWAFDNDLEASAMMELRNVPRSSRRCPTTYNDTEREDL